MNILRGSFISLLLVTLFFIGCASQLEKADKMSASNPQGAISIYEQVIKSKPGSEEAKQAHLKMAETYYKRMDNVEKGLQTYEEVAKAYPKTKYSAEAYWAIATHHFQSKDYEKAKSFFAKVVEEVPGTEMASDATLAIAKCHEEMNQYETAANLYLEFSKNNPNHRRAAQAGLDAAKIYESKLEDVDKAIEAYKFVATQYSISSSGREAREALSNMGINLSEAEMAGTETAQKPAVAEEQENEPREIANIGTRTRRRATNVPRPEIAAPRTTTAAAVQEQQRRTVSQDFGVDVMQLMPDITADQQGTMYDAMYMLGITYLQSEKFRESGALFEKAIELAGNKTWNNAARAYFYLGKSYKGIGNDEKANAMFKEAIKRDSKMIDEMIRNGDTQYTEEEYEAALDSYKTALGLVPYKDSEIYYKIGLVYMKLKDPDKELEAFERSVALKPNNIDALQHLAEVLYYRKNDPARATLYDIEAKGQGNNDYKVQKELGDLCYKYGSYSWARTKYGNGVRIITGMINSELKKQIGTGEQVKGIVDDPAKLNLTSVISAAKSGNQVAIDALKKIENLLNDYRFMNVRIVLSLTKNKQYKEAQDQLNTVNSNDPDAEKNAEYQFAVGLLMLEQGNKDAGISAIKKALEIDPNHKEASDKLKELGL